MRLHVNQLPCERTLFESRLAEYRSARTEHALTVGVPAPFPIYEIFRVIADHGGTVVIYDDTAAANPSVKERNKTRIDQKAGEVRLRYITDTPGQQGVYLVKERQAEEFKKLLYVGIPPALIKAEVDATGKTAQRATDDILALRDAWVAKAAQIEMERLKGKRLVDASATDLDADRAAQAAIAELEKL